MGWNGIGKEVKHVIIMQFGSHSLGMVTKPKCTTASLPTPSSESTVTIFQATPLRQCPSDSNQRHLELVIPLPCLAVVTHRTSGQG